MTSQSPTKALGAVSGSTYGAINASTSEQWMIRLPNRLASAWEDAPEGTMLGTLTFTKGGSISNGSVAGAPPAKRAKMSGGSNPPTSTSKVPSKISITIDPTLADTQSDLPVNYTLEAMSKKTPGALHPFTRSADGGVAIHGKITRTASAQVATGNSNISGTSDGKYRTLLRNRLLDTTVNSKRFVQPGGDSAQSGPLKAATAAASLGSGFGGSVAHFGKQMLNAKERAKGLGIPEVTGGPSITTKEGVRSTLFEFFSKRSFWAVKDLRLASGGRLEERQTREVLRDIADYHRAGEHKNMWSLKDEYKSAV